MPITMLFTDFVYYIEKDWDMKLLGSAKKKNMKEKAYLWRVLAYQLDQNKSRETTNKTFWTVKFLSNFDSNSNKIHCNKLCTVIEFCK